MSAKIVNCCRIMALLVMTLVVEIVHAGAVVEFYKSNEFNGNPNQSCPAHGTPNPINIASGNKYLEENIYKGGGEFPLTFDLYYNSRHFGNILNRPFVYGEWGYTYSQRLNIKTSSAAGFGVNIEMIRPNGQSQNFQYQSNNNYTGVLDSGPRVADITVANSLGELTYITATTEQVDYYNYITLDGTREKYDSSGKLIEIKNLQGGGTHVVTYSLPNSMTINYLETGQSMVVALSQGAIGGRITQLTNCPGSFGGCKDAASTYQYQYIPTNITTPDSIQYFFDFETVVTREFLIPRPNPWDLSICTAEFYNKCLGDKTVYTTRLNTIKWPDNTRRDFDYFITSNIQSYPKWIAESAVTEINSYSESGLKQSTSSVSYTQKGNAVFSTKGFNDVSEEHIVTENTQRVGYEWIVYNTRKLATTYEFLRVNNRPRLNSVSGNDLSTANCLPSNSTFTYDINGNRDLVTNTVSGSVTDYDYSLITNDINKVGLLNAITYKAVDNGLDRTVNYKWTTAVQGFRQIESIVKPGITIAYTYEYGRIKTYTETDTTVDPVGYIREHARSRTWTNNYTYIGSDADGLHRVETLTVVGPRLDSTTYTYNASGSLVSISNNLGHTTTYADHNGWGFPRKIISPNNQSSSLTYTTRGQLQSITTNTKSTTFSYTEDAKIRKVDFPNNSFIEYGYSDGGRLESLTNHLNEKLTIERITASNATEDFITKTFTSTGVQRMHTEMRFDALGRFWKMYNLGGSTSGITPLQEINYDTRGNPTTVTDGNSGQLTQLFDTLGRMYEVTDLRDSSSKVSYGFDTQDNTISVIDQENIETTYHYDGFGNLLRTVNPNAGRAIYKFDDAGNVTQVSDARWLTAYTYDLLNRLTTISTSPDTDVTYEYDSTNTNGRTNYGIGHLTAIVKQYGDRIDLIYSKRGNLIADIRTIAGNTYETQYEYNDGNNESEISAIHYPSGRIVDYIRVDGKINRIELRGTSNTIASFIKHEPFGPMARLQYGNRLWMTHTFDDLYRMDTLSTSLSGNIPLYLDYQYDNKSNVDIVSDMVDGTRTQDFGYDPVGRLNSAIGDYGDFGFQYDLVGNRTKLEWNFSTPKPYFELYDYQKSSSGTLLNQKLTGIRGSSANIPNRIFQYTNDGSIFKDNNREYTYDYRTGRVDSVREGINQTAAYDYNPLGQRDSKSVGSTTRQFIYGPQGQLLYEINLKQNWQRDYIYQDGRLIAFAEEAIWKGIYGNGASAPVVTQNGNTLTINQANVNGNNAYFAYGSLSGSGSISTKLPNVVGSTTGTEVGLEIRESTAANANYVRIVRYKKRPIVLIASDIIIPIMLPQEESIRVTYQNASGQKFIDYPVGTYQFVKIENIGGNITAWASSDGITWTQLGGTIALNVSANAVIGFQTKGLISSTIVNYQEISQIGAVPNAATMYYVHTDTLGTPQVITNSAQQVVWKATYKPFGEAVISVATIENNIRFPGQYFDSETGLHYNYFRYYDPATGRYITSDPIGIKRDYDKPQLKLAIQAGSLIETDIEEPLNHLYAYVGNNPIIRNDPFGLYWGIQQFYKAGQMQAMINYVKYQLGLATAVGVVAGGVVVAPLLPEAASVAGGICRAVIANPTTQAGIIDFTTSMFPGVPAMSGAGAAGAGFNYYFSPEEWFR